MGHALRQVVALILSVCLFSMLVFQKSVMGQMDTTGMLASMGGNVLTGIGVSGLVTHTPTCVSEGVDCDKMAMDVGMVAGGILAMMAGQSTADAASNTGASDLGNLSSGTGESGDLGSLDYGNLNYDTGTGNYNSDYGNYNSTPYTSTFCTDDGTCSVPDSVYSGLDTLAAGLSNGTITPAEGMTASETLDMATGNIAKLEDAVSKLQGKLKKDVDKSTAPQADKVASLSPSKLNFLTGGDDFFSSLSKGDKTANAQAPIRINGLDAEDTATGRKLTLFERATRRYNGTRDYNRAFTVARMELLRKRAQSYAKKDSTKKDLAARSPASIKTKSDKGLAVKSAKE